MSAQLELFSPNDELSMLKRELAAYRDSNLRSNRAQFAQINALGKHIIKLEERLDRITSNLIIEHK